MSLHALPRRFTVEGRRALSITRAIHDTFPELRVRHGIFRGMQYVEASAIGSELFPKLLGRYESELDDLLTEVCRCPYSDVVNVGCAEGYYAVGLARAIPDACVYAFDVDATALLRCRRMAALNGVADRVHTGAVCDQAVLITLPLGRRALILSDCEGYERKLFTPAVVASLRRHDFLIEVHDFINPTISRDLRTAFANTHRLHVIDSVDAARKVLTHRDLELDRYAPSRRAALIDERRPAPMQWFFFTPNS